MALNKREKTLAVVTGTLVAIAVAWFTFSTLTGPLTTRRALRDVQHELRKNVARLKTRIRILDIWAVPVVVALIAIVLALVRRGRAARFHATRRA